MEYSLEEATFIRKLAIDFSVDNTLSIDDIIFNLENTLKSDLRVIILSDDIDNKQLKLYHIKLYIRWIQIQAIKNHTFPPSYKVLSKDEICGIILGEKVYNELNGS